MNTLYIILLLVGVLFIVASFFITEKLDTNTKEDFKKLSREQIETIIRDRMADANSDLEDKLSETIDNSMDDLERKVDKETNEKIMAISEYADTVFSSMKKSHKEIEFMYTMLNDKQEILNNLSGEIAESESKLNSINETVALKLSMLDDMEKKRIEAEAQKAKAEAEELRKKEMEELAASNTAATDASMPEIMTAQFESAEDSENKNNNNKKILELHDMGMSEVDIAKQLGLGIGEIKFVLGLYKEN